MPTADFLKGYAGDAAEIPGLACMQSLQPAQV